LEITDELLKSPLTENSREIIYDFLTDIQKSHDYSSETRDLVIRIVIKLYEINGLSNAININNIPQEYVHPVTHSPKTFEPLIQEVIKTSYYEKPYFFDKAVIDFTKILTSQNLYLQIFCSPKYPVLNKYFPYFFLAFIMDKSQEYVMDLLIKKTQGFLNQKNSIQVNKQEYLQFMGKIKYYKDLSISIKFYLMKDFQYLRFRIANPQTYASKLYLLIQEHIFPIKKLPKPILYRKFILTYIKAMRTNAIDLIEQIVAEMDRLHPKPR